MLLLKKYKKIGIQFSLWKGFCQNFSKKGRAEKSIEIAKKMLIEGIDLSIILKVTGLSTKEIEELKEEIEKLKLE